MKFLKFLKIAIVIGIIFAILMTSLFLYAPNTAALLIFILSLVMLAIAIVSLVLMPKIVKKIVDERLTSKK